MRLRLLNKFILMAMMFSLNIMLVGNSFAAELTNNKQENLSVDRIELVTQQINLLKSRVQQANGELTALLSGKDGTISANVIDKYSKNILDKASLEISVSTSTLQSITVELGDVQQTINWLERNVQELNNQLNVLNIFGAKMAKSEIANPADLRKDLAYQQQLLQLEKVRLDYLQGLQKTISNVLQLKKDNYQRLNTEIKMHKLLHIKQQQVRDELAYQEQQNAWLLQVNALYAKLAKIDPSVNHEAYSNTERDIFYANENANYAYVQSLVARYKDQMQQMNLAVSKSNSISLLNEIDDQIQLVGKQMTKLDVLLKSRMSVLQKHIAYLTPRKNNDPALSDYITALNGLVQKYQSADTTINALNKSILTLRESLDQSLQSELSLRQGLPTFSVKMMLDLGKEVLLVPALTFQIVKNTTTQMFKSVETASAVMWSSFALFELAMVFSFYFIQKWLVRVLAAPSEWREKLNTKWIGLQWLQRNLADLFVMVNILIVLFFTNVPQQTLLLVLYLSLVWLIFKGVLLLSRLCFNPTFYRRVKWLILAAGLVTGLTVFVHQLPLIYEIKALCDRLFLLFTLLISILLIRSWRVLPEFILSQMNVTHAYVARSVRLFGLLVPILIFTNSLLGLMGFLNLVMTMAWYEGIFMMVLVAYIAIRGLLNEGFQLLSSLALQYTANGWLWTEAFIKPIHRVLRITLFLSAGALLFLFYGWDNQSPTVERLTRLLHYHLASVLGTDITPLNVIELVVVISVFYWTAKWTREFVFRLLAKSTRDMGIRNSLAVLTQYAVVVLGAFIGLRVLGINFQALAVMGGMFALGVGLGLRDLINNFACGFLILLERPLRVGDIVNINGVEGEVVTIGSRAVTVRTWDYMDMVVPNTEIFNKTFINWTGRNNVVRTVFRIKISRYDNPHLVEKVIYAVLHKHKDVLKDPDAEVYLREMNDSLMDFEVRYFVNIRKIESRTGVLSSVLTSIWDAFNEHGIKPPMAQQEILIRKDSPSF